MTHTVRYYRFAGRLYRDRSFRWRPGYVTESATGYHDPARDSPFAVRLLDRDGTTLIEHPIEVLFGNWADDPATAHIREKIPWRDETSALELLEQDRVLFRADSPGPPPELTLEVDADGASRARDDDTLELRWVARKADDRKLAYYLAYSCDGGKTFEPLGTRRMETKASIRAGRLPGGEACCFRLRASDGLNTVEVLSRSFSRPRIGPLAEIGLPEPDEEHPPGARILVRGHGTSPQERLDPETSYVWLFDGKEVSRRRTFSLDLPHVPGEFTLELIASDSAGATSRATRRIVLREPPPQVGHN